MSIRQKVKVRGGAAAVVAAVLVLTLAGCGGDEKPKQPQGSAASQSPNSQAPAPTGSNSAKPLETIATAQGPSGIVMEINSVERDQDGYLTVSGQFKNTGSSAFAQMALWRGDEKSASPGSIAGATLVDAVGKKRYYVLRDTEGRCACTTGLTVIKPAEAVPFFAQFPAPPATTSEVSFGLPSFAATTIKISG